MLILILNDFVFISYHFTLDYVFSFYFIHWMCPLLNLSQFLLSHLMAMSLYIFSWTCRSVSLSASSDLDKVFCRGCVFLLGYLISFCLGIMNNFYALIHRYTYIYLELHLKTFNTFLRTLSN